MAIYKSLRITSNIGALAPPKLDMRASATAIHLRSHGGIGYHVTAAMGFRKSKSDSGPGEIQPNEITDAP